MFDANPNCAHAQLRMLEASSPGWPAVAGYDKYFYATLAGSTLYVFITGEIFISMRRLRGSFTLGPVGIFRISSPKPLADRRL